ncbi:MAG: transglycosylase SLT domain-containing protein, partial [Polyangiaceae bacterium]|nr:transglycosylase SLT domain-containing protein [Polyangiaceae bacterium]
MKTVWFTRAILLALVLSTPAVALAAGASKPPATSAAPKPKSKPAPAPAPAKKTRSAQPQQPPSPAARRATAGPGVPSAPPQDPPERVALSEAETEMFWFDDPSSATEFYPLALLPEPTGPVTSASGLPPTAAEPRKESEPPNVDFVSSLRQPDFPVPWTPRVVSYLEYFKNDPRGRTTLAVWYRQSGRYEKMLRSVLKQHKLPEDLMWVAVVESGLRPTVYSPAGAAGLWQFMPESGRLYGLVVDRWVDERLDPVRSTNAAAMYLQDLYRRFGSWELALASYNMG